MPTPLSHAPRRAWAGVLLPLALLAGCGQTEDTTQDTTDARSTMADAQTTTAAAPDDAAATSAAAVTVSASAEVGSPTLPGLDPSSRGLLVTYEVRHDGDVPLLVARDRGHGQNTASRAPDNDESVWVDVTDADTGDGEVLRLSKKIWPLSGGALVEERETTLGADLLAPGDTLTGTAFVPAPVRLDGPRHGDAASQPEVPVEDLPARWQLCLEVAPDDGRAGVIGRLTADRSVACSSLAALPEGL